MSFLLVVPREGLQMSATVGLMISMLGVLELIRREKNSGSRICRCILVRQEQTRASPIPLAVLQRSRGRHRQVSTEVAAFLDEWQSFEMASVCCFGESVSLAQQKTFFSDRYYESASELVLRLWCQNNTGTAMSSRGASVPIPGLAFLTSES